MKKIKKNRHKRESKYSSQTSSPLRIEGLFGARTAASNIATNAIADGWQPSKQTFLSFVKDNSKQQNIETIICQFLKDNPSYQVDTCNVEDALYHLVANMENDGKTYSINQGVILSFPPGYNYTIFSME